MADVTKRGDNPYVGPQAFKYGEKLYGRDRELLGLLDLLIAERIVMLYSPSGAGKSSLVQAGLMPKLEGEGFWVLPVMRVSLEPPAGIAAETSNRYVLSAILWLEEGRDEAERLTDAELAGLTLADYLDRREAALEDLEGTVLIFDQFEEILTVDPTDRTAKQAFFQQVGEALRAPHRWALFSLREDYIAGLDPYLRLIPTRLNTTFRLELLGEAAAREAIQKPARDAGVDFTDPAALKLVDNLLGKMLVQQADGSTREERGLYVEPVQLQVVCLDLWDRLPAQTTRIEPSHIDQVGDVDTALANYYATAVERIARDYDVPERVIRQWCGQELITQGGIRGQILRQEAAIHGMPAQVINALVDVYLVRAEKRRGLTWYELAHDRLIKPVQTDNDRWEAGHLSTLQRQAALWVDKGRPEGLLLRAEALVDAERWAEDHADELQDPERDFLARSQEVREAEEREKRLSRLIRLSAIGLAVVFLVALGAAIFAGVKATEANQQRATAVAALKTVAAVQTAVKAADQLALEKGQTAVAAQVAVATAQSGGTPNVRQQQTAEAALRTATVAIAQADAARNQAEQALVEGLAAVSPTDTPIATPTRTSIPVPTDTATPTPEPTPQPVSGDRLIQITQDSADEYVPSYSPDRRRLVIESNRTGEWQIFTLDPEGGDWRQLTDDGSDNHHPRIAPDGETVIYASDASGNQELYSMTLDGTGLRQLTDSPGPDTYPSYTRDGRRVVFMSRRSGNWGIYAMNADGSDQRVVYDTEEADEAYPHISPDGRHVVFQSDESGNWEIYIIPIDGSSQPRRLTDNPARDAQPVFSPDGGSIAFETNRDGDYEIYIMDANGGNQRNLTQFESGNDQVPFFASDGSLVFQSNRNGSWDIYQIPLQAAPTIATERTPIVTPTPTPYPRLVYVREDMAGTQSWQYAMAILSGEDGATLQDLVVYASAPAWSPSGDRIAFSSEEVADGQADVFWATGGIWIVDAEVEDPTPRPLNSEIKGVANMAWSPDGTKLALGIEPVSDDVSTRKVVVIDDGGREINRFSGEQPAWIDDEHLVVKAWEGTSGGLFTVECINNKCDEPGKQQITFDASDSYPAVSSDGDTLVFTSRRPPDDNDWEIYRLNISGGAPRGEPERLTFHDGEDITPVFSPDGGEIFYRSHDPDLYKWRIRAVRVGGGEPRVVAPDVGASERNWGLFRPSVEPRP